ncbi:MAG: hypothetical protein HY294_03725 [Candidatus Rokubacteria bacterium]|nr:hypothetical protein [Candidatus Rokubacteria bacterium]MBI3825085.1 hypothetical protein [Candidatus Rokubacteria bacterium]
MEDRYFELRDLPCEAPIAAKSSGWSEPGRRRPMTLTTTMNSRRELSVYRVGGRGRAGGRAARRLTDNATR